MREACAIALALAAALSGAAGAADPAGTERCRGMAAVPAGEFLMGSADGGYDERPRRAVYLDVFLIDRCEVTAGEFEAFMKAAGRQAPQPGWSRPSVPAVAADWYEADAYCRRAGKRLPTEAEWEKAARGGLNGEYGFKGDPGLLDDYAWYDENSGGRAHPAGLKKANPYGLYDMHGNAAEWTADWYDPAYYAAAPRRDPRGPAGGLQRVIRGGGWNSSGLYFYRNLRAAERSRDYPARRSSSVGFRCARDAAR